MSEIEPANGIYIDGEHFEYAGQLEINPMGIARLVPPIRVQPGSGVILVVRGESIAQWFGDDEGRLRQVCEYLRMDRIFP